MSALPHPKDTDPIASDAADWERLRLDADESSFATLFNRYADVVYNYCFRRLGAWTQAEDATQNAFTSMWRRARAGRLDPLSGDSCIGLILWLARAACGDQHRRNTRHLRAVDAERRRAPDSCDDVAVWIEAEATMSTINASLAALTPEQRDVVELVCWSDLSLASAATALQVPIGTVKSRLSRAREALRHSPAAQLLGAHA